MTNQEKRNRIKEGLLHASETTAQGGRADSSRGFHIPEKLETLEPIAIVGVAGFFPKSRSVRDFWSSLDQDRSLLEEIPEDRFNWEVLEKVYGAEKARKHSRRGGLIPQMEAFDPLFFNISPAEANLMDPRQRLLLMAVYQALEDACYAPESLRGTKTGVFIAAEENQYGQILRDLGADPGDGISQSDSMLANRISYFFDFRGPSEFINTMCSGGAVAVHRAVCALRSGEIKCAVAGTANLLLRPEQYLVLARGGQLSPDDSVNSFGKGAEGYLRAEGVAAIVLKPLIRAEADGDSIYALIKNSAVNFNGQGGMSIAAPNAAAHAELIRECYAKANVDPRELGYIEAQGMGNPVADLAEWTAFNRALQILARERGVDLTPGSCGVSTVKPMMGHMDSASAFGALLKVIRSFQTNTIHKILHFSEANPDLELTNQPCRLMRESEDWPGTVTPRLAGIHSFGSGGVNAHILLQEHKGASGSESAAAPIAKACARMFIFSARTEDQLRNVITDFYQFLQEPGSATLSDIAYSLQVGRNSMEERLGILAHSLEDLRHVLEQVLAGFSGAKRGIDGVFFGSIRRYEEAIKTLDRDEDAAHMIEAWAEKEKVSKILELWAKGLRIDWRTFYVDEPARNGVSANGGGRRCRKVRLPGYPFAKEKCWVGVEAPRIQEKVQSAPGKTRAIVKEGISIRDRLGQADSMEERESVLKDFLSDLIERTFLLASAPDVDVPLNSFGLNSLMLLRLKGEMEELAGGEVELRFLMEKTSTIAGLAAHLTRSMQGEPDGPIEGTFPRAPSQNESVPEESDSVFPLAYNQRALWFLHQIAPDNRAYNLTYLFRLGRDVSADALEKSFQKLIARHAVLRTTYSAKASEPFQCAHASTEFQLTIVNTERCKESEVSDWLEKNADLPFDLEKGPVFRAHLLVGLPTSAPLLVFTIHHIAWDFVSFEIMARELGAFYDEAVSGVGAVLPRLKWSYQDYVRWEQERLSGARGKVSWEFWRKTLAGDLPVLNFPADRQRTPVQSYRGATFDFSLDKEAHRKLKTFCKENGTTPYMALLSVFYVLLFRYTGQEDLLVGAPMMGRNQKELSDLLGYFITEVVLRVPLKRTQTFLELLKETSAHVLEVLEHQDYPFSLLVEKLQPARDPSRSPLFQVSMNWQELPDREQADPGRSLISSFEGNQRGAPFDFILNLIGEQDGIGGQWVYAVDLFEQRTMEQLSFHFSHLLNAALDQPDRCISEIPLFSEREKRQMLAEWNATEMEYPKNACVHEVFEEQVERTPEARAILFEGGSLTYRELNGRANQLGHALIKLGVTPDTLVAIALERSPGLIVALLATLKAGGAYVPLDPDYPSERLAFMLEDSGARILLTQEDLRERLPHMVPPTLYVDAEDECFAQEAQNNPERPIFPDHLAYVIYTSGSTGVPKGVPVEHRSVVNRLHWMQSEFPLTGIDRVLQKTPASFDVSVWEFFWPLQVGATLVLAGPGGHRDNSYLSRLIEDAAITTLHFVPPMLQVFLEQGATERSCGSLRRVFCSGEELPASLQRRFFECLPDCTLVNLYGPTEATVDVSWYICAAGDEHARVPIGRPIANTQLYILDRYLEPTPIGVPGELYIGGTGVARGYLNRPELTAERFIPDPFSNKPKARLYKTGDLVRYRTDGNIEFLERLDHQVKIRGFRVELGEIESVLSEHPSARQSAVVAQEISAADKRLAAFVIPSPGETFDAPALRRFLSERLPSYMIPSSFTAIPEFPLTKNGKLDRRALAMRSMGANENSEDARVAPRSPDEEILVEIWKDVLKRPQVGIQSNFFELGGHSLLAMQVISRVRDVFSIELSVQVLFQHPTIVGMVEHLGAYRSLQGLSPITPLAPGTVPPLSFAQNRLRFLSQLGGQTAAYNIPLALQLDGSLDLRALKQSLHELGLRHQTLRSYFPIVNGGPAVRFSEDSIDLTVSNLESVPLAEREEMLRRLLQEEAGRMFDLDSGPLVRAVLWRLEDQAYVLALTMHHIVSDGWSMEILIRELGELYSSFSKEQASPLSPLPIQYGDFAAWQERCFEEERSKASLVYWKTQLAGAPPLLELPTDSPRPSVQSYRGSFFRFHVESSLADELKSFSREEGATLFMTLLSAYAVLLSRYAGTEDVVIGSQVAGRNYSQIESVVGLFINTLALRIDLSGNPEFRVLLKRVKDVALGAYTHLDTPFDRVVDELQPERTLRHSPIFQVMFVLQNQPLSQLDLPGVKSTILLPEQAPAKFDLVLTMEEISGGLSGTFEYNTDLFERSTIERITGHFTTILCAICGSRDQPIQRFPLLRAREEHQLLIEWNATSRPYAKEKCIHEVFEEHARRAPDAAAIFFRGEVMTYGELNQKANQLAGHLISLGVHAESLVGLCLERSFEMFIGLLGILKAGGAYVPLDPAYPRESLATILDDSRPTAVVTLEKWAETLPRIEGAMVCLDRDSEEISIRTKENPRLQSSSSHLCYIIYTSGSTGKPKGVMVEHHSVARLVLNTNYIELGPKDRCLQCGSIAFDNSTFEVWGQLLNGGAVCSLPPETSVLSSSEISELIRAQGITVVSWVCSVFNHHVSTGIDLFKDLQTIVIGGEKASTTHINKLKETWPEIRIILTYGPTENTTFSTYHWVERIHSRDFPIGKPIANSEVVILNAHGQLAPIGVPGELCTGGEGLARGYLNNPELTAQKFIQHPYRTERGARLYRTGDLARILPDGNVEYLGRMDDQVKVRGFRIELGEIESVLTQHPGVRESAVIVHEIDTLDKRLAAFFVPANGATAPPQELRRFVGERLPDHMVPSVFVSIESIPQTRTGKVDRRALSRIPVDFNQAADGAYLAPRSLHEEMMVEIWQSVLHLKHIGVQDNFFDLGGHSLLAMQIMSRIRDVFAIEPSLQLLLKNPTVLGMVEQIESRRFAEAPPPIVHLGEDQIVPLSFAQSRFWFLAQFEGQNETYNLPLPFRLEGPLNVEILERSIRDLLHRHPTLQSCFPIVDGEPMPRRTEVSFLLRTAYLEGLHGKEAESAIREMVDEEAQRSFDLAAGPVFRGLLIRLGEVSHVLVLTMHHIVSDGWSMGILIRELGELYRAYSQGLPSPLRPLPIQYGDFAAWQKAWLGSGRLQEQLDFWKAKLADAPPLLELPTDYSRPAIQTYHGETLHLRLDREVTDRLRALARQEDATLFMTLTSVFGLFLARYSRSEDIVMGSLIAGRNHSQIESIVGVFVNTLALRMDFSGNPSFVSLLRRVKQTILEAYIHQDVPFDKLVQAVEPDRNLSHAPVFQVMFVLQSIPFEQLQLAGVKASILQPGNPTAKFDLGLSMQVEGDTLSGMIEYNRALFKRETAARMMAHLLELFNGVATDPAKGIYDYPLLAGSEPALLATRNGSEQPPSSDRRCLADLFEEQVSKRPEAIALVLGEEKWSYLELNTRANRLANRLRAAGIGPDKLVGICLERSLDMIVAILGVLKAGGGYLPIDPSYPTNRISFFLEDSQVPIVLTHSALAEKLGAFPGETICLDTANGSVNWSPENPVSGVEPWHLAYVIYTSGSTGNPKGVQVTHANVVRLFTSTRSWFQFDEKDVWTLFHSYAFDFSVWEIWGALLHGGVLVVVPYEISRSPSAFHHLLAREKVTVLNQTPSAFRQLSKFEEETESLEPCCLRYVIFGGEALEIEHLRPWFERHGDQHPRLINMYGITETTVHVTYQPLTVQDSSGVGNVIGVPIPDLQTYILDRYLHPTPIGVPGELHVGGAGLARGYLNRPDLTKERFILNPVSDAASDRLYKTGDLARFLPDGKLEYLGRIDNQVQIRGFRIELGEIESVLLQHPAVRESVVLVHEVSSMDKRLVAFVTSRKGQVLESQELRRFVGERLPSYMVPQSFIPLEELPSTQNGKIDRCALLLNSMQNDQASGKAYIAPRDGLELQIGQIWEEVLKVSPIGVHDDFFDLGGHSMLAVKVMTRIGRALDRALPLSMLFQGASVEKLANLLRDEEAALSPLVSIHSVGSKIPFFCFPGAGGNAVYLYELARQLGEDQPFYGLQGHGLDGESPPHTRVEDMAAQWIDEIQAIQPEGPYLLGGHSFGGKIALEAAQQLMRRGLRLGLLVLIGTTAPHPAILPVGKDWDDCQCLIELAKAVEGFLKLDLKMTREALEPLSSEERIVFFKDRLTELNWLPPELSLKQFKGIVAVYKANVCAHYQPESFSRLPHILLIKGEDEQRFWELQNEPAWGWDRFSDRVSIHVNPGDHSTILMRPHAALLAEKLKYFFSEIS
jgi:amino acid adenylation domain-containing protein